MTQPEPLTEAEVMRLAEWQKKREVAMDWAKRAQSPLNNDEIKELAALLVEKNRFVAPLVTLYHTKGKIDPRAQAEFTLLRAIAEDMHDDNRERIEHVLEQHWLTTAHNRTDPVEEKAAKLDSERIGRYLEELKRGWRGSDGHIGAG